MFSKRGHKLRDLNLKIIGLVKRQELLWNSTLKGYHDHERKRKLWEDIAQEVSLTVEETKVKWKTQRDLFRKELLRMKHKAVTFSRWKYFPYVIFLKDLMPLELVHNIEDIEFYERHYGTTFDIDPYDIDIPNEDNQHIPIKWNKPPNLDFNMTNEFTVKTENNYDDTNTYIEMEPDKNIFEEIDDGVNLSENLDNDDDVLYEYTKQTELSNTVEKDSDYLFLISLLPFIQNISIKQKLIVRIRLMNILCMEKLNFPIHSPSNGKTKFNVKYEENSFLKYDYDYLFLLSLLPFCNLIPEERKLFVRKKMMEILGKNE